MLYFAKYIGIYTEKYIIPKNSFIILVQIGLD